MAMIRLVPKEETATLVFQKDFWDIFINEIPDLPPHCHIQYSFIIYCQWDYGISFTSSYDFNSGLKLSFASARHKLLLRDYEINISNGGIVMFNPMQLDTFVLSF